MYVPIKALIDVSVASCVNAFITSPSLYIVIPSIGNLSISNIPDVISLALPLKLFSLIEVFT